MKKFYMIEMAATTSTPSESDLWQRYSGRYTKENDCRKVLEAKVLEHERGWRTPIKLRLLECGVIEEITTTQTP